MAPHEPDPDRAVTAGTAPLDLDSARPWLGQARELAALLARGNGVQAVVLLGSVARGEEAAATVDGRAELFSDLEFLAVTARILSGASQRALTAGARRLAATFGYRSSLFHVDVAYRSARRLGSLPHTVFAFEARECGRVLTGPDLRFLLPAVTGLSLDRRRNREILLKRLWHLASALPLDWLATGRVGDGDPGSVAARSWSVAMARQVLDIPTVLLPEVGVLLAGYGARARAWNHPTLAFHPHMDRAVGDGRALVSAAMSRRSAAAPLDSGDSQFATTVNALEAALDYVSGVRTSTAPPHATEHLAGSPFREWPRTPGEVLGLARHVTQVPHVLRPRSLHAGRKRVLADGLLALNRAATAHRANRAGEAAAALEHARAHFDRLTHPQPPVGDGFVERWAEVRELAGVAHWRVIGLGRGIGPRAAAT